MTPRSNPQPAIDRLIELLKEKYQVELAFLDEAIDDLSSYDNGLAIKILGEIAKKAKAPYLMPKGSLIPLHGPLAGCGKIRMLADMIRIIVRPTERPDAPCLLEVIAIGPKAREEAYALATVRYRQMKK